MDPRDLNRVLEHLPSNVAVLRAVPGFPVVAMTRQLRAMAIDPDRVLERPVFESFPETPGSRGSIGKLTASFERVIRTKTAEHYEQRYDMLNPATGAFEERYWSAMNSPVLGDDGDVEYILHQAEDVATQARHGSMAVLDAMTEGVFTLDRQWRFSYVNPEAHRILRAEPGSLVGEVIWTRFPGSEDSAFGENYRHTMQAREMRRFTAYYPGLDGWYEVTAYPAPEGISVYFRDVSARVLAEQDRERILAESEQQRRLYETALNNTPDFVYIFGTDHRAIYANESLLKVWGTDDVRGKTWMDLGYEQWHADMHDRELAQVIATRAPIRGEIPFTGTNGRRIYDYIFAPVFDAEGRVVAVAGTTRDVTDRQTAEQMIREHAERLADSRARLDYAVRLSGIGFWYCDLPFDVLNWDERVKEHFWLPPDAHVTIETFYERIHPDDREPTRAAIATSNELGTPYDMYYRTCEPGGDGVKWIRALGGTAFDADGQPIRFDGVTVDVTAQKTIEAESRRLATRLQTIIDTIPTGLIMLDEAGSLVFENDEWRRTWAADAPTAARGDAAYKAFDPDTGARIAAEAWPAAVALRDGAEARDVVLDIERLDGTRGTIVVSSAPFRDEAGRVVGAVAANMDISELRAAQARLQDADRRKDEFLAMLAHELRNPLAPIGTSAQILKRSGEDRARVAHAARIIERQVGHLTSLVDDLLDVSRVTRGLVSIEREAVDLRAVVSAAVEQVQPLLQARQHELRTALAPGDFYVTGDFNRLVQVVTNLLTNAAKYTPQNGSIALEIGAEGAQAVIRVCDNGVGISADLLDDVFELFTQAECTPDRTQGGLGIGLALVRSLVGLHGGTVTAHSEGANRGSTFTVRLPLARRTERRASPPSGEAGALRRRRVLLVDDNADAAATLAELLGLLGHDVAVAGDGASALATASRGGWDIVVLDIGLPDMTGFELAEHLRRDAAPDATFVALTGYGQAHDRVMSRAAGFDHHMVKPPNIEKLIEILDGA